MSDYVWVLVTRPMGRIGANYWFRTEKEAMRFAVKINLLYPHLPRLRPIAIGITNSLRPMERFNGDLLVINAGWSGEKPVAVQYDKEWANDNQDKVFTIHPLSLVEVKL